MSYCRWSSANWKCDVYCYLSTEGYYTTQVATKRIIGDVPPMDWSSDEALYKSGKAQAAFMETCRREPIGLAADGAVYEENTLRDLCKRLVYLKGLGYNVPQWVIDNVLGEIEEEDDNESN